MTTTHLLQGALLGVHRRLRGPLQLVLPLRLVEVRLPGREHRRRPPQAPRLLLHLEVLCVSVFVYILER